MFEHVYAHSSYLHILAAVVAVLVGGWMCAHSKSVKVRHTLAHGEHELRYNMQLLALYLYSIALDFLAAALAADQLFHVAAIAFNCILGGILALTFTVRVMKRWNG